MKLSLNSKKVLQGVIIALIVSSLATGTYFVQEKLDTSYDFPFSPFEWDFQSPVKLSLQMQERSKNLLAVDVYVGIINSICTTGDGTAIRTDLLPYFNDTFYWFSSWYNVEDDEWLLSHSESHLHEPVIIKPEQLNPLHSSFSADLHTMYNVTELASIEDKFNYIDIGDLHYFVLHFYKDGTLIIFDLYDDVVFIRSSVAKKYKSDGLSFGIYGSKFGSRRDYICYTTESMTNYTIAVSDFLYQVVGEQ